ncbi:MAG: transglutaminase-like domain-containing protein [Ignavibacteria bacterium]|nr:transglutaminase-like domain-containing protein [Ignavibacteria bacterium]
MRIRNLILLILFLTTAVVYGQITTAGFQEFAAKQDSLFVVAYKQKDVNTYNKLLTEFLSEYDKLSADDKKNFSFYLNGAYYNLCCAYSLLDNKEMALTYLKKSIDAGYFDYYHIQEDKDLDNIRKENEFLDINNQLRNIGDFLYILEKAGKYNPADNRQLPEFTYQSRDNPNLTALRMVFNLDSIAGKGTDVLKILNLLHWVHNLIPHDGNHNNPVVKNAMSMIAECKRDNRGLNCRGLALVLNECYLSLGIKSRIVTCLPKDSLKIDSDCHVINLVYSDTLKKWLWIDPTFNAYVMNEKGELLSIEEVRDRIINDKPVILNPDANWNNKTPQSKEYYLFNYMAKNLYILECPVNSEYDMETTESGKSYSYIQLLPLEYFKQLPDKTETVGKKTNTTWIVYKTNNPDLFWKKP